MERWLLLIHQIPPKPDYLRVKTWRHLQRVGAVSIKNSVYVLPNTEQAREDLEWVLREISDGGGDGSICEAKFIDGLSDDQVIGFFQAARDVDYQSIAKDARALKQTGKKRLSSATLGSFSRDAARLRKRLTDVSNLDFFDASGRHTVEALVREVEQQLEARSGRSEVQMNSSNETKAPEGATWVTREGIRVDRMASAWLIKRFIDSGARFKFVPAKGYATKRGELRFDMFEAEYTHEGDRCTFEVLLDRFSLHDPALRALGEIVHDIDLKESKFGREESPGIARLIDGIALAHKDDEARLTAATAMWNALYEYFRTKAG